MPLFAPSPGPMPLAAYRHAVEELRLSPLADPASPRHSACTTARLYAGLRAARLYFALSAPDRLRADAWHRAQWRERHPVAAARLDAALTRRVATEAGSAPTPQLALGLERAEVCDG